MTRRSKFFLVALLLAGCAAPQRAAVPPPGPLSQVDWDNSRVCAVAADEKGFRGENVIFVEGEASILQIRNESDQHLSFRAAAFYKNITPWKLATVSEGKPMRLTCGTMDIQRIPREVREVSYAEGPELISIGSSPRETHYLYFIPRKAGIYAFDCIVDQTAKCAESSSITVMPKAK